MKTLIFWSRLTPSTDIGPAFRVPWHPTGAKSPPLSRFSFQKGGQDSIPVASLWCGRDARIGLHQKRPFQLPLGFKTPLWACSRRSFRPGRPAPTQHCLFYTTGGFGSLFQTRRFFPGQRFLNTLPQTAPQNPDSQTGQQPHRHRNPPRSSNSPRHQRSQDSRTSPPFHQH